MFRLSFKLLLAVVLSVAGLTPRFAVAAIMQEKLGPDGFPTTWKQSDFAIGTKIVSDTVWVSGTSMGAAKAVTPSALPMLDKSKVERVGVLTLGTGGEAPDLWQKATRAEAEEGLTRAVAQGVASPGLREGWRRVLLSEGDAPLNADKGERRNWVAVRADALEKMGLYEAAWGLWRAVPQASLAEDAMAQGWVEAKLLAGQGAEGCSLAKNKVVAGAQVTDKNVGNWPVIVAVCQLVVPNGDSPAAAGLSLQLVEPTLKAKNPSLLRVLNSVQDGKPLMTLGGPQSMVDGLGGAVLAAYPALVGPEILPRMPDMALRRLMESGGLPNDLRGRAAVALARQTGLPQDGVEAWKLVSSTSFAGTLPDAVLVAKGVKGVSVTAVGTVVEAALRLGQVDAAAKMMPVWMGVQGLNATESRERVQAQMALGALQGRVDDRLWDMWLLAQALDNQAGVRNAQRSLLVVEGLGVPVPSRVWAQMRDRALPVSTLVDPAWQRLLAVAVQSQNVPGSLGLISEAWVGQPPAGVVPVVMGASIEALRRIGMEDVARRVAAEAMLGIPASHLIQLMQETGQAVSATAPVALGADAEAVSGTRVPANDGIMLPPPRVKAPTKPTITAPTKPVAPTMGR